MSIMRLILIEDNHRLAEMIRLALEANGFAVDRFATLAEARRALAGVAYDLILLDLGMPDGDGVDLIATLRRKKVMTPVLIITARDGIGDRVRGLDFGADDYLVKPFATEELAARCRALLRRPGGALGTVLEAGNVALDTANREVRVAGRAVSMPPREVVLLELLMRHSGRVVTKAAIDSGLYALHAVVTPNAIDTAVSRLRRRLTGANASVSIYTAHGIGYLLNVPATSAESSG
jgi:DNA-binding response OmpR family regulator